MSANESRKQQLEQLVSRYSRDLHRYAQWLCRDGARAEDLVQETFLRAWRSIDSLRDPASAKSWLITILRRENARQYERYTPKFEDDFDFDSLAADKKSDHDAEAVQVALGQLDQKYAEPLVLQVIFGHSCEEIGGILGLSKAAVTTRVHRARLQMLQLLSAEFSDTRGRARARPRHLPLAA